MLLKLLVSIGLIVLRAHVCILCLITAPPAPLSSCPVSLLFPAAQFHDASAFLARGPLVIAGSPGGRTDWGPIARLGLRLEA